VIDIVLSILQYRKYFRYYGRKIPEEILGTFVSLYALLPNYFR